MSRSPWIPCTMVVMPAIMPQPSERLPTDVCAVVLGGGGGRRLRPLSLVRPKPLCPVGGVALLDLAIDRARTAVADVAVNVHHGRGMIEEHPATGGGGHGPVGGDEGPRTGGG